MNNIEYVEYTDNNPDNAQVSSGEAIDLGLSVKWASCNVGASSPEQFGDFLAWGEMTPKSRYTNDNYIYYDHSTDSYIDIGMNIGGTDYDAAHVKWGGNWRMPFLNELLELKYNCTWEWSKVNGMNGFVVTGPNGNSIFIPCSDKTIVLWACTISNNELGGKYGWVNAILFDGKTKHKGNTSWARYREGSIRPVRP
jgi:hypothetical protein